jgi:hypothetical protein
MQELEGLSKSSFTIAIGNFKCINVSRKHISTHVEDRVLPGLYSPIERACQGIWRIIKDNIHGI